MIRIILFITILIAGLQISAQNFAPVGAKWHYQSRSPGPPIFGSPYTYLAFEVIKDTIIEAKPVKILGFESYRTTYVYFHEDDDKLYFYEDGQFKMIFDYGMQIGDTLEFWIPQNYSAYDVACTGGLDTIPYYAVLDSTSIFTVDNIPLKQYHTRSIIKNTDPIKYWDLPTITERMFSIKDFFGLGPIICLGGYDGHFRCYEDADIFYKPVSEACDAATGIANTLDKDYIKAFPNPVTDKLTIEYYGNEIFTAEIYSLDGVLISKNVISSKRNEIWLNDLPAGIYLLMIKENGYFKKIIKL